MNLKNKILISTKIAAKIKKREIIFGAKNQTSFFKIPKYFVVSFKNRYLFLKNNSIFNIRIKKNKKYLKRIIPLYFTLKRKIVCTLFGLLKMFISSAFLSGLGFKHEQKKKMLLFYLGYSHTIKMRIPENITIFSPKENILLFTGLIKEKLINFIKIVQKKKFPDLYKNRGVIIKGEFLRKKKFKKNN